MTPSQFFQAGVDYIVENDLTQSECVKCCSVHQLKAALVELEGKYLDAVCERERVRNVSWAPQLDYDIYCRIRQYGNKGRQMFGHSQWNLQKYTWRRNQVTHAIANPELLGDDVVNEPDPVIQQLFEREPGRHYTPEDIQELALALVLHCTSTRKEPYISRLDREPIEAELKMTGFVIGPRSPLHKAGDYKMYSVDTGSIGHYLSCTFPPLQCEVMEEVD